MKELNTVLTRTCGRLLVAGACAAGAMPLALGWQVIGSDLAAVTEATAGDGKSDAKADSISSDDLIAFEWDRRAVEHLWNRAGFGIADADVQPWVDAGPAALIDHLFDRRPLDGHEPVPNFEYDEARFDRRAYAELSEPKKREMRRKRNQERNRGFAEFRRTWVKQVLNGDDPLRDRMTLFWHGFFTTSYQKVKHPGSIAAQHETLRRGALQSYAQLLRDMLQDPAMLRYLDNDKNRKGKPNENLAREVMELFSLGEGNYTEKDVQEAARALTGAGVANPAQGGTYRFFPRRHDKGQKTILGVAGRHRPQHLATILLEQPACSRYVAKSVIEYFEGVAPAEERVESYAKVLRETDYDVGALLRRLFVDPAFYRDDVVGARVTSPFDFVVGAAIRLGGDVPADFVVEASNSLGQDLFRPPSVKGWDEGLTWITTSTFMMRGNVAGALLGQVSPQTMRADAIEFVRDMAQDMQESGEMDESMTPKEMRKMGRQQLQRDAMTRLVRILARTEYATPRDLAKKLRVHEPKTDEAVVRALCYLMLAIEPPVETVALLTGRLTEMREAETIEEAHFVASSRRSEDLLEELTHLILSLPEAQLH